MIHETAYARLQADLVARLPGLTVDFCIETLVTVLRDWFRKSGTWRETFTDTTDKLGDCIGVVPTRGELERIVGIRTETGTPVTDWWLVGDVVRFANPRSSTSLIFELVLVPSARGQAEEVPDELIDRHYNGLLEGALAVLYEMPAKPWSSDRLALYHRRRFTREWTNAKRAVDSRGNQRLTTWRFPYFGARRHG